jgi:pimeloyl-ACP methyl ester carboxylesterase
MRTIAYDDEGDGELAFLMLPGWCATRRAFRPLYPHLAHRAIAVDWRGHGGSAPADRDFGTRELVDDAIAAASAAGAEIIVPVATAHAGWVAIELRKRLGAARVPKIVLVDWMVLGAPPPFVAGIAALQQAESFETTRAGLATMWTTGVESRAVHAFVAEMMTFGFDMWRRAGREIAAGFAACPVPLAALDGMDCPTLHVQPANLELVAAQRAYAAAHPWFSVVEVPARSHFPTIESPAEVAAAIDAFV